MLTISSCNISKLRQPNVPRKFFVFSSIGTSAANHLLGETNRMVVQNISLVKYDNRGLVSRTRAGRVQILRRHAGHLYVEHFVSNILSFVVLNIVKNNVILPLKL